MGGGWTKTKLMLNSTQVEVEVEVGVELGNKSMQVNRQSMQECRNASVRVRTISDFFCHAHLCLYQDKIRTSIQYC